MCPEIFLYSSLLFALSTNSLIRFGNKDFFDKRITEYIAGQLDEGFPDLLHQYFQKEHLMEKWLDDTFS